MEYLFWFVVLWIFYAYFGYPFTLFVLSRNSAKITNHSDDYTPLVSLIIAGYNIEDIIDEKLANTLQLDYPNLEIIVSSDGSTDSTVDKANYYREKNGVIVLNNIRAGKENAQKEAVRIAKGDILVFTDCSISLEPNSIRLIVSNFADSTIGGISAEPIVIGCGGEGIYQRYDVKIREMESKVNTLVGLSGAFFACRKDVCDLTNGLDSDFKTALDAVKRGYRTVLDNRIKASYKDSNSKSHEFSRKVRTLIRGMNVFFHHLDLLNIFKYGIFSYQFFCHKLLKWLVPFALIVALLTNVVLAVGSYFYTLLLMGQILFYTLSALGAYGILTNKTIIKIPTFFVLVNVAILFAWIKYITGERMVCWIPTKRII
jgi:glycosyltransferase involved in cell wall biosynthesis